MAVAMASGSGGRASMVDQMVVHEKPEVKRGGSLLQQNEHFVENRTCKDVIWAILFILLAACIAIGTIWTIIMVFSFENVEGANDHQVFLKTHENTFIYGLMSILAAGLASAFFSIVFLQFAKRNPECVVWTALILGPMCIILVGAYLMTQSWPMPGIWGAVCVFVGGCLLACVIWACKDLVPLTVLLLRTVIHVVEVHPSMMALSAISALLALAWSLSCIACLLGSVIVDEDMMVLVESRASKSPGKAALVFLFAFIYIWGSLVATNTAHTACAGVYGRWYFGKDGGSPVAQSLRVAWTTSFGSICYGCFIVAVVRAVQALVSYMRAEAEEEGNFVLAILLRIIECIIDCVGDIIEGITEWAYVQCAVRALGFCDACWATFAVWCAASMNAIVGSCLIDLVPFLGASMVGALSGATGFLVYHSRMVVGGYNTTVFAFCFLVGFLSSIAALMPLKSGSCTIIICFGEDPDFLRRRAPALFEALTQAQIEYDADSSVGSASSSRRGSHQHQVQNQGGQARDVRAAPLMEMQPQGQPQGR
mmetsp:Transcript_72730/g.115450  ORF Transcript_72730/g.115450 Transcript_72730/m.115450 type:complete len:538 (+) Transcript_72730:73-1686(+)